MKTKKIYSFFPLFLVMLLLSGCSKNDNLSYSNSNKSHSPVSIQSDSGEIHINKKELKAKNNNQEITIKNGNMVLKNGEEKIEISKDAIGNSVREIKQNDNGINDDPMMKLLMN